MNLHIIPTKETSEINMDKKRLLFIPVSSPEGIGEYIRSLSIAQALIEQYIDDLQIHFVLNKHTNYAASCPFPKTLLPHSATKNPQQVNELIDSYRPDVVIFDCAGRASQMKKAKAIGAKVIFISQHAKKRAKGLKFNRINLIDKHWVVQPDFCLERLNFKERMMLKVLPLARPENVGAYFNGLNTQLESDFFNKLQLKKHDYFLVNAGSGGHIADKQLYADIYLDAAKLIAKNTGLKGVVVLGANYPKDLPQSDDLIMIKNLSSHKFVALLKNARCAVLSAGDSLLQAIALNVPTVASAISKDQPQRLAKCQKAGFVVTAEAVAEDLAKKTQTLLFSTNLELQLAQLATQPKTQGKTIILSDLKAMLFGEKN